MKDAIIQFKVHKEFKEVAKAYAERKNYGTLTHLFISSVRREMERNP